METKGSTPSTTSDTPRQKKVVEPDYPQWSSRTLCFQAYVCFLMSFSTKMEFAKAASEFGLVLVFPMVCIRTIVGVPTCLLEIMLGRYITGNIAEIWNLTPFSQGMLYCRLLLTVSSLIFSHLSTSHLLKYLFSTFRAELPWQDCSKAWAKSNCYVPGKNMSGYMECIKKKEAIYCKNITWETSAEQYWKYFPGVTDSAIPLVFAFLALGFSIFLVPVINYKGIRSLEKLFVIFVHLPLILSLIFAFVSFTILGSSNGLAKVWFWDASLLQNKEVWLIGFEYTIMSMGVGMLCLSFISSHGSFFDDVFVDVLVVNFADVFFTFFIFTPVLSIVAMVKDYDIIFTFDREDIGFGNNLDLFIWISEAFTFYPYPRTLWSFIFYLEMVLLAMGTQAIMSLAANEALMGICSRFSSHFYVSLCSAIFVFIISGNMLFLPYYFVFPMGTSILTVVIMSIITIEAFYGVQKFNDDFHFMMGYPPPMILRFAWGASIIVLMVTLGLKIAYNMPDYPTEYIIYIYMGLPIFVYMSAATIKILRVWVKASFVSAFRFNPDWGPGNDVLKKSRIVFNSRVATKEFMYRQELYKKSFMKPHDFKEQNIVQLY